MARSRPVRRSPPAAPPTRRGVRSASVVRHALAALLALSCVVAPAHARAQPPLDIDTADAATLAAALPGIGPVKARRIVEHRTRHGPFGGLDALQAVKGIGPATVARIRAHLGAEAGGTPASDAPREHGASGGEALSTSELERATRAAVREIVEAAERDAARHR